MDVQHYEFFFSLSLFHLTADVFNCHLNTGGSPRILSKLIICMQLMRGGLLVCSLQNKRLSSWQEYCNAAWRLAPIKTLRLCFVCMSILFQASCHLTVTSDDANMVTLWDYWLERHTNMQEHTHQPQCWQSGHISLKNRLKFNLETKQCNTPPHHEQL